MTEDAVDAPPRAVRRVAPAYPSGARRRGQTGYVTLTLTIGADGRVQAVRVVESVPAGVFDDVARSTLRGGKGKGRIGLECRGHLTRARRGGGPRQGALGGAARVL